MLKLLRHEPRLLLSCICSLLIVAAYFFLIPWTPAEDALILFQYSEHLANLGRIVYNITDPAPVEGATDFLWMLSLSLLYRLGIDTFVAAKCLSALSLAGIVVLLTKFASTPKTKPASLYLFFTCIMLLQVPVIAASTGFSVCTFGFCLLLTLWFARQKRFSPMILAGLITCLIRPDGLLVIAPLVIGYCIRYRHMLTRNDVFLLTLVFIGGIGYFLWRWHYFGHFLPLPFYVKSDAPRLFGFINRTSYSALGILLFLLSPVLLFYIWRLKKEYDACWYYEAPLFIVPILFYGAMELQQNIALRFFYPIILCLFALAAAHTQKYVRQLLLACILCCVIQFPYYTKSLEQVTKPLTSHQIGRALGSLEHKGVLLTSEAGGLSYYSGWQLIDTYGLNTPSIATGGLTPDFIRQSKADLIIIRDYPTPPHFRMDRWIGMLSTIHKGVDSSKYTLLSLPPSARFGLVLQNTSFREFITSTPTLVGVPQHFMNFLFSYPGGEVLLVWVRKDSPYYSQLEPLMIAEGATPVIRPEIYNK